MPHSQGHTLSTAPRVVWPQPLTRSLLIHIYTTLMGVTLGSRSRFSQGNREAPWGASGRAWEDGCGEAGVPGIPLLPSASLLQEAPCLPLQPLFRVPGRRFFQVCWATPPVPGKTNR